MFEPAAPKAPRSSVTRRSAGTAARCSRQTRCPARTPAAGIDAASMARRCQSPLRNRECFLHLLTSRRGRVGWGFDRRRDRRDAGGSPRSANHLIERGPTASARNSSKLGNPLNPAVQAGFRRTASRRAEPQPSLSQARRGPAAKRSTSTKSTVMTTRPARRVLMACVDPATSRRMTAWTHGR
jgi:hypothetical protein